MSAYNNLDRGFYEWFKPKINEFLKKRITAPNHIYTLLLSEFEKTRINDDDEIVDYYIGKRDIIKVPPYKAIKNY